MGTNHSRARTRAPLPDRFWLAEWWDSTCRTLRFCAHAIEFIAAVAVFCTFLRIQQDNAQAAHLASLSVDAADLGALFPAPPLVLVDKDGDGVADLANPAGLMREIDLYGSGHFHAQRDSGKRKHEGVDYVAFAGEDIRAPLAGVVTREGYAYHDDKILRFVEIRDAALAMTARVFYINSALVVGQTVAAGEVIGTAQSLAARYPLITNHVHVELDDARGRHLDPSTILPPADPSYAFAMKQATPIAVSAVAGETQPGGTPVRSATFVSFNSPG